MRREKGLVGRIFHWVGSKKKCRQESGKSWGTVFAKKIFHSYVLGISVKTKGDFRKREATFGKRSRPPRSKASGAEKGCVPALLFFLQLLFFLPDQIAPDGFDKSAAVACQLEERGYDRIQGHFQVFIFPEGIEK